MAERVVLLTGNDGPQVASYRTIVPKPLLPIGDRAVLDLSLRQLGNQGLTDVTLAVGELAPLARAMFGDGARQGLRLDYAPGPERFGAAGLLAELDPEDPFIAADAAVVSDLDHRALLAAHVASGDAITVAVHQRRIPVGYDVLEVGADGGVPRIRGAVEHPEATFTVNMGIYALDRAALDHVLPGERLELRALVSRILAMGGRVGAFAWDGLWLDMRQRADHEEAESRATEIAERLTRPVRLTPAVTPVTPVAPVAAAATRGLTAAA